MAFVLTNAGRKTLLDLAVDGTLTGAGPLSGVRVMLYTDGPSPNPDMTFASFTVATFTGYADSTAVTWGTSFYDDGDVPTVAGDAKTFIMTDTVAPETITGYALIIGADPNEVLLGAEDFPSPIALSVAGQGVVVAPVLQLSATEFGQAELVS